MTIYLLLIVHFLADHCLSLNRTDDQRLPWCRWFMRSLVYALPLLAILLGHSPISRSISLWAAIVLIHAASDLLLWFVKIKKQRSLDYNRNLLPAFLILKGLPVLVILVCGLLAGPLSTYSLYIRELSLQLFTLQEMHNVAVYILMLIICLAPAAELIQLILNLRTSQGVQLVVDARTHDASIADRNGYLVGMLERTVILILGFHGQLGAIGFVLAAKSIARYKQLEDKIFAEKYLIGTLLSAVISLVFLVIGKALLQS